MIELRECFGGEREIQVFRELTKKFEQQIGSTINEVIDYFEGKEVLGEITLVIKGKDKSTKNSEVDSYKLKRDLHDLTKAGLTLSAASKYLAKKNNLTKSKVYKMY